MFGSLMMFASGVLASSPSSASASGDPLLVGQAIRELGQDAPGQRDVAQLDVDARLAGERLDDRQERVRRQCRRLVRVGVDELHQACPSSVIAWPRRLSAILRWRWRTHRPPATCCAPRTSPTRATPSRSTSTTWPRAAGLSRAHFSREFRRAFGESPHVYLLTRRLERAAALLRTTDRSIADICFSVGLSSIGSFTTSFTRMFEKSPPPTGASFPPAVARVVVPSCVVRAYGRSIAPPNTADTFREDSGAAPD